MLTDSAQEPASDGETRHQPMPLAGEVGVVALVPDRWSPQWQLRHQVLSRLAGYFSVVWVNPAPEWRDVWRSPSSYVVPDPHPQPGLRIHSPDRALPRFYRPAWLARATARLRVEGARRRLLRAGCTKIVLYIWRPDFAPALATVQHDLSCYHIDDEYTFSTSDEPIAKTELELLQQVDQVILQSPGLLEKKGHINPCSHFVPNGVDFAAHAERAPEPADLRDIARPRIGYTGWLKRQLDWGLLETLAKRHSEWSFVFVGSRNPEIAARVEEFGRLPNVHLLGGKSSAELARYPQHFDVCLMPYNDDGYTRYINPLKLYEYLASGTPTVGTPIRSLEPFRSVVELARGSDEWSAAIERTLRNPSEERRLDRQAVAREYDWGILVQRIAQHMADAMEPEIAERVRAAGGEVGA